MAPRPDREREKRIRGGGRKTGNARAEEEDDHHAAPAPFVAEPAGRKRAEPDQHEGAERELKQRAVAHLGKGLLQREDRRRVDEHDVVVERVAEIGEEDDAASHAFRRGNTGWLLNGH